MTEELRILVDAITAVGGLGSKGEAKIVQWIRGSSLQWTSEYDETTLSYGLKEVRCGGKNLSDSVM